MNILFQQLGRPLLGFAVVIGIWQVVLAEWVSVPSYLLPLPSVIGERWWDTRYDQFHHLLATASTTLIGLALSLVVGVALALLVVYVKSLKTILTPMLAAFNSIPKVAIAPVLVIWFGLGLETKVVFSFLLSVFPIFVNSTTGLGEVEPEVLELSRLSGGTHWRIFTKVRLINAVPYIIDAIKVAFPLALVGSIVGEFIAGNLGSGYLVLSGQFNLDTPLVFATLGTITGFAMIGTALLTLFEQVFVTWRPSDRSR